MLKAISISDIESYIEIFEITLYSELKNIKIHGLISLSIAQVCHHMIGIGVVIDIIDIKIRTMLIFSIY